jgi:hypothetical protein
MAAGHSDVKLTDAEGRTCVAKNVTLGSGRGRCGKRLPDECSSYLSEQGDAFGGLVRYLDTKGLMQVLVLQGPAPRIPPW